MTDPTPTPPHKGRGAPCGEVLGQAKRPLDIWSLARQESRANHGQLIQGQLLYCCHYFSGYRRRRIPRSTAILLPKKVAIDLAVTRIFCTFVRRNCNNETRSKKKVQHPHPVACPSQDGAADSIMLQDAARLKVRLFGSHAPFYCQIII